MKILQFQPGDVVREHEELTPIIGQLRGEQARLREYRIEALLDYFDAFGQNLLQDVRTQSLEGIMFLSSWLRRRHLENTLRLSLGREIQHLDGFVKYGSNYLSAKPHGLVSMWMAGNVDTLPPFSFVPALLAKNVSLVKLATPQAGAMGVILDVLESTHGGGIQGRDLVKALAVVWFDYQDQEINRQMSWAADAKVMWGGEAAIKGIGALPKREHCIEIVHGPKYSIGLISRGHLEGARNVDDTVQSFVRDIAAFDQRACSSPQMIFCEKNGRFDLRDIAEKFAAAFRKLPPKRGLDAYTTIRILNIRADYAMREGCDVIASQDGANWTVCMDRDSSLKEAVQSRTVFLTEIESWRDVIRHLNPKIQTVGVAFDDIPEAIAFADAATGAGVARCVKPGLMNVFDYPWDGHFMMHDLVRWVSLKA